MEKIIIIGVDLAKNVFQVHGAATDGTVLFRKKLTRAQFHRFMAEQTGLLGSDGGLLRRAQVRSAKVARKKEGAIVLVDATKPRCTRSLFAFRRWRRLAASLSPSATDPRHSSLNVRS